MSLVRTIPKNQSKWIRGIAPPIRGNYLIAFLRPDEDISQIYEDLNKGSYLNRLTYSPENNYWFHKDGIVWYRDIKIQASSNITYDILWWDEYGYFNEPYKLKIKFPNDREENK
jgi:hypothetical protein